jgi:hypothetical protein
MATSTEDHLIQLTREEPIKAGFLKIDWRLSWLAACIGTIMLAIIGSALAKYLWLGFAYTFVAVVSYIVMIGLQVFERMNTSLLSLLFRRLNHHWSKNLFTSKQPLLGEIFGELSVADQQRPYIPILGRINFEPYEPTDPTKPPVGIAIDRRYGTRSATIVTDGASLQAFDTETQQARFVGFAEVLNLLAAPGNPVSRFVWRDRTELGEPQNAAALIGEVSKAVGLTPRSIDGGETFVANLAKRSQEAVVHRTSMTLTIHSASVRRQAKILGGTSEVLAEQLRTFYTKIKGPEGHSPIGLRGAALMSYDQLILETRKALDPVFAAQYQEKFDRAWDPTRPALNPNIAFPAYADFEPRDHVWVGQTCHIGFYFESFTERGTDPDQFWELSRIKVPKTMTFVVQMVSKGRARTRAEVASTGILGANKTKAAANRRVTENQKETAAQTVQQEWELAKRKGRVGRMRGYIDVTGSSLEEAKANAQKIHGASVNAEFVLERLDGQHELGIEAAMLVGRGLAANETFTW